jgi:uncharacterized repeat protein (TIGR01451 family)
MNKKVLNRLFASIALFSILVNVISAPLIAYADDVVDPTPTPTVEPAPIEEPSPTPTEEPSPTPEITPEPTVEPIPTEEVTPTPEITPEPTTEPTLTETPTETPSSTEPPANTETQTSTETPIPTVEVIEPVENGQLHATIVENAKAETVDEVDFDFDYQTDGSASLSTDKADYAPTDTVVITGTGFSVNEEYTLEITSETGNFKFSDKVTSDESGGLFYTYQLDGTYRPNYKVEAIDKDGTVIAVATFTDSESGTTSLPFSESFGSGASDINEVPGWYDRDSSGGNTRVESSGGQAGAYGHIEDNEWICRTFNATGLTSLQLQYYWKGDSDAGSGDNGLVQYKTGGNCSDSSGWNTAVSNDLDTNTGSWVLQNNALNSSLNNTTFRLRFYNNSINSYPGDSPNDEDYRVDTISITATSSHTINASANPGGSISPSGAVSVNHGANHAFDITPSATYIVSDVLVDGGSVGRLNSYTFNNVTVNHSIAASFGGGWKAPNNTANDNGVSNENNAFSSNNAYATFNNSDDWVNYRDFNLSIPSGSIINGIEVAIEGSRTSGRGLNISLSWNGGSNDTSDKNISSSFTGSDKTFILGGSGDTWGRTWSSSDFSNANFRVRADATSGSGDINIDQIQVKVSYTTAVDNPELQDSCGMDIILVLDSSDSMNGDDIQAVKDAAITLVDALMPATPTRIGVIDFDTNVIMPTLGLTNDKAAVLAKINSIGHTLALEYTNWDAALQEADGGVGAGALIVIITDGNPTLSSGPLSDLQDAVMAANAIKSSGSRILAIGIDSHGGSGGLDLDNLIAISGDQVNTNPLTSINDVDVITENIDNLGTVLENLAGTLCGGTINITKLIDGEPQSGWNFSTNIQPGQGTIQPPSGQTGTDGTVQFDVNVTGETASVDITEAQDHSGYSLENAVCYINDQPVGNFDGHDSVMNINMGGRDIVSCTFINTHNGSFFGTKWEDINGDGNMTDAETGIPGWTIFIDENDDGVLNGEESYQTTDENGYYQFTNLPARIYSVCEVEHDDMIRTFPVDSNCQEAVVIAGQPNGSYDFGNMPAESSLEVTKSNDKAAAAAGDTVTYTLVVKNTGKSTLEVNIVDVLPGGFTYILGTAHKNDEVGLFEPDPILLTLGILSWNVGFLGAGDEVKITYQAKINSDISAGTYKNIATCKGYYRSQEGRGDPASECDPVDSSVSIGQSLSYGGSLTPMVLGLSTEVLPATGNETALLFLTLVAGGFGILTKIKANKLGKGKHAKN